MLHQPYITSRGLTPSSKWKKVSGRSVAAGILCAMFGLMIAAAPSAYAAAGGSINFFDVGGTVASPTCTSTAWSGGTFYDGNVGFGGNLGIDRWIPIVSNGEQICIEVVLVDQQPDTTYTISSQYLTLVSGTNPFKTDSSGNADVFLIFSVSGLSGGCSTQPIKISPGVSGSATTANQIHHIYGGSGPCTPNSVPQFPMGMVALFALAVPALLLVRRNWLRA